MLWEKMFLGKKSLGKNIFGKKGLWEKRSLGKVVWEKCTPVLIFSVNSLMFF